MRVAFAIFKGFPHGGVARDLRKIATECVARGHAVTIYAMRWQDAPIAGARIITLPSRGLRGHVRQRRFATGAAAHWRGNAFDLVVGMNKMPGIDVYYAGDSCFVAKARAQRPWLYRATFRYRHFAAFERAVFSARAHTRILAISPRETGVYAATHGTPAHRFHPLPPGLERDRALADARSAQAVRDALGVGAGDRLLLFVGSGFVKKGLDRVLRALAALPTPLRAHTRLGIAGADRPRRFQRLARRLGIAGQVCFLGGRDDVPALLRAADGLVLPAYDENTGTVILESAAAGLPALVTANCGYASFVGDHDTGIVTPEPFDQTRFNADLERLLTSPARPGWTERGRALGRDERLYAMASDAVDLLQRFAAAPARPLVALAAFDFAPTDPKYRLLAAAAAACARRGLAVRVYACTWSGAAPADVAVVRLPVAAWSAAARLARYQRRLARRLRRDRARCVVGFDAALTGVDIRCGSSRLAPARGDETPADWSATPLPPGLGRPPTGNPPVRSRPGDNICLAMIGDDLVARGADRLFAALGALPAQTRARCRVAAAGRLAKEHLAAAHAFGLGDRVRVSANGEPEDILAAADVLVDLPFQPAADSWVFNALAAGAVVLTHQEVAEARLVRAARAGVVLPTPYRQADCDQALARLLDAPHRRRDWAANAARFAARPQHYHAAECVAKRIATWLHGAATVAGGDDASASA